MHIVLVHQCSDAILAAGAAQHQSLHIRQVLAHTPVRHLEGNEGIGLADLRIGRPPCRAMLPVAYGLGLDIVQRVVVTQQCQSADDGHHDACRRKEYPEVIHGRLVSRTGHRFSLSPADAGVLRPHPCPPVPPSYSRRHPHQPRHCRGRDRPYSVLGSAAPRLSTGWMDVPQQAT